MSALVMRPLLVEDDSSTKVTKKPVVDPIDNLAETAISYVRLGWPVYPVQPIIDGHCGCGDLNCAKPGKHPQGKLAPHGRLNATDDEATISLWWSQEPSANIGLATGTESAIVLDVDRKHGGLEALGELERQHGPLPGLLMAATGSQVGQPDFPANGIGHFYFSRDDSVV